MVVTRTLAVMAHPTSLAFDSNGNLWVGGQGFVYEVSIANWNVSASSPVDGTVNGVAYDSNSGVLIQGILQNGNALFHSNFTTMSNAINYSTTSGNSYSTENLYNVATGASVTSTTIGDNAAYSTSSVSSLLAFPAQGAVTPPIYSSTVDDITATVAGTSFTISAVSSGNVLIQGTLPYPARGVAVSPTMVYFTMPDSNSLLSLPVKLP